MKKSRYLQSSFYPLGALLLAILPIRVLGEGVVFPPPATVSAVELQEQRLAALYAKRNPAGDLQATQRATRGFLEHLRTSSPIAAEKFMAGRMDDGELESRFDVFLKDRPELYGRAQEGGASSPRVKVAEILKNDASVANDDAGRLALADRFLERLAERSSMASDSLRTGKMPTEELQSRVTIFISDLKAEASTVSADPAAAALEAVIDAFIRTNFGREGERVGAISYQGSIEENGVKREFIIFRKRPEKIRMHFIKEGLVASVLGYDGKNAWRQAPGKEAVRVPAEELAALRKIARFDPPLVGVRERGAEIIREDKVGNGPITLRIRERDGAEFVSMIDPETLNELSTRSQGSGGSVEETRYMDHRKLGVLNVAHTQEQWLDGALRSTTHITDVRLEPGLLDSFFSPPEKQSLGFMDYMGALVVIKDRAAQQASAKPAASGDKP